MFLALPLSQTATDVGNQPIVVSTTLNQVVTWIIIGLVAGFLASVLVRGRRANLGGSIIIGLVGAIVGGALYSLFNLGVPAALQGGIVLPYIDMCVSFVGALIVLILANVFRRG